MIHTHIFITNFTMVLRCSEHILRCGSAWQRVARSLWLSRRRIGSTASPASMPGGTCQHVWLPGLINGPGKRCFLFEEYLKYHPKIGYIVVELPWTPIEWGLWSPYRCWEVTTARVEMDERPKTGHWGTAVDSLGHDPPTWLLLECQCHGLFYCEVHWGPIVVTDHCFFGSSTGVYASGVDINYTHPPKL